MDAFKYLNNFIYKKNYIWNNNNDDNNNKFQLIRDIKLVFKT